MKKIFSMVVILLMMPALTLMANEKIGVLYVVHGGMETNKPQHMWDAAILQFSFDHNHSVNRFVIWNSANWPLVLDTNVSDFTLKYLRLFDFEYERIGGTDPFHSLSEAQMVDIKEALDTNPYGITFEVDWAGFQCADRHDHYPYPRFIYYGPDGPGVGDNVTYCGQAEKEGVILQFLTGTSAFTVGATLTGQTSGASAVIDAVTIDSGTWAGGTAAGYLSLSSVSGSFEDDEAVVDSGAVPGSAVADGTTKWEGCDPERYNVDGPVERLLNKGVSRIIVIDWMMGGVRYSKSYDVVEMTKRVIEDWNDAHATSIPEPLWVNDYSSLMKRSYPTEPAGWTASLGAPMVDSHVLLNGAPNPVASDPLVATLDMEAIEAAFSGTVSDANTGVILLNHTMHADYNQLFDPKINDTLIVNKNIKDQLLTTHPTMDPNNIIGAFLGRQEVNPENGLFEHTRRMRGEVYGKAWLYETDRQMPGAEWGYQCWDALEYLKDRGVQHIVIGVPQVVTSSVLDMVELHNQIGREIGIKSWAKWGTGDYAKYPTVGHPFANYWGMWVYTDCGEWELGYNQGTSAFAGAATLTGQTSGATGVIKWLTGNATTGTLTLKEVSGTFQNGELITDDKGGSASANGTEIVTSKPECCFEMEGCDDPLRLYPPPRLTPLNRARSDLDPSLVYDLSDYGHLGYDPLLTPPDPNSPVQDQYTGTWAMYSPPDDDPRVGQMLASQVLNAAVNPMVYITNGNLLGIGLGESVTFEAHVIGGISSYSYQWFSNKDNAGWSAVVGESNSAWTWTPGSGDEAIYDIRCSVTDSQTNTGEGVWERFVVPDPDNDGLPSAEENCPTTPNPDQFDTYPPQGNGIGDACECEGNFNCSVDNDVDGTDAATFKADFGRSQFQRPCVSENTCNGDFSCDSDVDGTDAALFKSDFGRSQFSNPCPTCILGVPWCVYP